MGNFNCSHGTGLLWKCHWTMGGDWPCWRPISQIVQFGDTSMVSALQLSLKFKASLPLFDGWFCFGTYAWRFAGINTLRYDGPTSFCFQPRSFFRYRLDQKNINRGPYVCRRQIFGQDSSPRSFCLSMAVFHSYPTAKIRVTQNNLHSYHKFNRIWDVSDDIKKLGFFLGSFFIVLFESFF